MSTNFSRASASVVLACAVTVAAAGCGKQTNSAGPPASVTPAPSQSVTSQAASSQAPSADVTAPAPSTIAVPSTPPAASVTAASPSLTPLARQTVVSVYLLNNGHIAASHRVVFGPAVARAAVESLLVGPTESDAAFGYVSKVPSNVQLSGLTISDGTARLSLTGNVSIPAAGVAQVVCTLTQFSSVDRVAVTLNGNALTIPSAGTSLTRADVEAMLPAVLVESPTVGETVRTPLRVVGSANTFEAVLRLEVTDWDGRIVADVIAHATSGTGTRGTFDVTIPFIVNRAGIGEVIASYDSPKDGSRVVVAEIPLHVSN
jgi:hypothetical protein